MDLAILRLKKNEERRLRAGHVWIYSNEIDTKTSPLKSFTAGQEVRVEAYDKTPLGIAYINPQSLIAARLISKDVQERMSEEWLLTRLQKALAWRQSFYAKPYYRLAFGESDGLPGLVVDRFNEHLVVQITTKGMEAQKSVIIKSLTTLLPEVKSILFRNDSGSRAHEGMESYVEAGFGAPPAFLTLEENETLFKISLLDGQKTGWFYDHRLNRARLKDYVANKRVLDVFSYLGGWGIQAARLGAREVVCLDASRTATELTLENAALNQLQDKVTVICDDAFVGLKKLSQSSEKFDVIILDPPAFVKKFKDKKEGFIAYQRINEAALKLLKNGGILISCSCSMHMSAEDLLLAVHRAGLNTHRELQIVERGHQAPDHPVHPAIPETDYLKMIIAKDIGRE
jgi:23S rRNA (cytosine1962-C5)-methyltransferase